MEFNTELVIATANEAAEAQRNAREFRALASKRRAQGLPLAAEAAEESAASWRRKEEACAEIIRAEIEKL